ncbi:MAG TPA: dihydroorotate dehydrogenase electron transfer subunit [Proteobacteria bacterium]|nr:dihydroorotate dehydrogenase electron transfer subunit [Pseudomonadota bacterium]
MKARLVEKVEVAGDLFLVRLAVDGLTGEPEPGQFFMIYPPRAELILGRPMSVFGFDGSGRQPVVEFLMKRVGRGTNSILDVPQGAEIRVIGPLGNRFDGEFGSDRVWLVAGGYGVSPLAFLMRTLLGRGVDTYLIQGYRTGSDLVGSDVLGLPADRVFSACEDGSSGFHGTAYELWKQKIEETGGGTTIACGPAGLLRALWRECSRRGMRLVVSLEARMGCGFGVCFSCAVPLAGGGYARVCYDGPVFDAAEIDWDRLDSA